MPLVLMESLRSLAPVTPFKQVSSVKITIRKVIGKWIKKQSTSRGWVVDCRWMSFFCRERFDDCRWMSFFCRERFDECRWLSFICRERFVDCRIVS